MRPGVYGSMSVCMSVCVCRSAYLVPLARELGENVLFGHQQFDSFGQSTMAGFFLEATKKSRLGGKVSITYSVSIRWEQSPPLTGKHRGQCDSCKIPHK